MKQNSYRGFYHGTSRLVLFAQDLMLSRPDASAGSALQPPVSLTVPKLVEMYGRAELSERSLIELRLLQLDPHGQVAIPEMRGCLEDYPKEARKEAMQLLARFRDARD